MQMIQDGQYANAPDKPLRMTGTAESCRVSVAACEVVMRMPVFFCGPTFKLTFATNLLLEVPVGLDSVNGERDICIEFL